MALTVNTLHPENKFSFVPSARETPEIRKKKKKKFSPNIKLLTISLTTLII